MFLGLGFGCVAAGCQRVAGGDGVGQCGFGFAQGFGAGIGGLPCAGQCRLGLGQFGGAGGRQIRLGAGAGRGGGQGDGLSGYGLGQGGFGLGFGFAFCVQQLFRGGQRGFHFAQSGVLGRQSLRLRRVSGAVVIGLMAQSGHLGLNLLHAGLTVVQLRLVGLAPCPCVVQRLFQLGDAGGAFARQPFLFTAPSHGAVLGPLKVGQAVGADLGLGPQMGNLGQGVGILRGQIGQTALHLAAGPVDGQAVFRPVRVVSHGQRQIEPGGLHDCAQRIGGGLPGIKRFCPGAQIQNVDPVQMARLAQPLQHIRLGARRVQFQMHRLGQRPQGVQHLRHGLHRNRHRPHRSQPRQQIKQHRQRRLQAAMGQIAEQVQRPLPGLRPDRHRQHIDLRVGGQPCGQGLGQVGIGLDQDDARGRM